MHGEDYVCLGFLFGERFKVAYISDISRFLPSTEKCKHCHSPYCLILLSLPFYVLHTVSCYNMLLMIMYCKINTMGWSLYLFKISYFIYDMTARSIIFFIWRKIWRQKHHVLIKIKKAQGRSWQYKNANEMVTPYNWWL